MIIDQRHSFMALRAISLFGRASNPVLLTDTV
jgi:hypothetical protein